uniref:Uncharacterized protein n=1 Tax=candidate division CPR3 bacterium TaxID=2268181 RepID=A0A7C4R4I1_UNCC3
MFVLYKLLKSFIFSTFLIIIFLILPKSSVKAVFTRQSPSPLLSIIPNSWESKFIANSMVIFDENILKLWYTGSDYSKYQIGYIESHTPTGFTLDKNNPQPPQLPWDFSSSEQGIEHPFVILSKNSQGIKIYELWFNNRYFVGSDFRFDIYYSSSTDGINWNTPEKITFDKEALWDTRGRGVPSIIKKLNQYHMWFTARADDGKWRIGYAYSDNGKSWVRYENPVLEAQSGWETENNEFGIGNAYVFEENGLFHMFYGGGRSIGYAYSSNGKSWNRSSENPIFLPNIQNESAFDHEWVHDPAVIKYNGDYYLYYSGRRSKEENIWQIGVAKSNTLPSIPITLTPTPSPFSPIIIIPGLGASWNPKDIFSCSLSSSGNWRLAPYVSLYNRLIKTLTDNAHLQLNKDLYVYGYDWRQPLDKQGENLKNFIDKISSEKPAGTKFRIVGHSLGGLVGRSYIVNNPNSHKVAKFMTVGSPHEGTVLAYPLWEKGEVWTDDKIVRTAVTQLIKYCRFFFSNSFPLKTEREVLQSMVPSVKSILPVFDYLKKKGQSDTIPTSSLKNQNDWLSQHKFQFSDSFPSQSLTTLSGNDNLTIRYLEVINPRTRESLSGDWIDGKPVKREKIKEGDGTVLNLSSQIDGVDNKLIGGNHTDIISSDKAIREILKFLDLTDVQPAEKMFIPEETTEKTLTISIDKPATFEFTNQDKKTEKYTDNLVVIFQPKIGIYKLRIIPTETTPANLYLALFDESKYDENFIKIKMIKDKPINYLLIYKSKSDLPRIIPL